MTKGIARSGDVQLAYSVEGSGPETVLLVMGLGGRSADWGYRFPSALAERYRVVRFDNRGTGASSVTPGGFTLDDMARDATAVLDAVDAPRAHVIGISMGGMIAQLLALNHPERVDHLVLLATHFGGGRVVPPTAEAMKLFDPQQFALRNRSPVEMMRFTLSVITAPGFLTRDAEAFEALLGYVKAQPTRPMGFMGQLQAVLQSDRSERVRDIERPTLVVHGKQDALIPPANGEKLAELIPNARLVLFDDCGHMPMWEKAEELSQIVLSFFEGPRGPTP